MNKLKAVTVLREAVSALDDMSTCTQEHCSGCRDRMAEVRDSIEALTANVADGRDELTYTVDGESLSQLEYINHLHDKLADRAAIQPAAETLPAGWLFGGGWFDRGDAKTTHQVRTHGRPLYAATISEGTETAALRTDLGLAKLTIEQLTERLRQADACIEKQGISEGSASAGVVAKTTPYLGVGRRATDVKISVGQQWKTRSGRVATIKEIHPPLPYPHAEAMVTFDIFDTKFQEVSHDHRCGLDGRENIDRHHSNDLVEYIASHTPEHIERVLGKGAAGEAQRRIDACLRAFVGVSTEDIEESKPVLELLVQKQGEINQLNQNAALARIAPRKTMITKPIARELLSLIEQHAQASVRVYVASKECANTNKELDEKHNAQLIKAALYKFIDEHTEG